MSNDPGAHHHILLTPDRVPPPAEDTETVAVLDTRASTVTASEADINARLAGEAVRRGLVTAAQASRALSEQGHTDPEAFATWFAASGLAAEDRMREILDGLREDFVPGYRIHSVLGRGGMGIVYKALQTALNRTVALKVLQAPRAADETFLRRFRREAHTAARLNHPNIIQAIDFGESDGRVWLVLEHVDGENAHDAVHRDGPMPETRALRIIRDAARGLAHAHAQGIIHRDVKPSNILLVRAAGTGDAASGSVVAKVADLGLARPEPDGSSSELTEAGHLLGTPAYMAPEQAKTSAVDHRADIYALGTTLYYLLTGSVPFRAPSLAAVIEKKLHGKVANPQDLVRGLSDAVVAFVDRLMARTPDLRPPSYEVLLRELDALLDGSEHDAPVALPESASSMHRTSGGAFREAAAGDPGPNGRGSPDAARHSGPGAGIRRSRERGWRILAWAATAAAIAAAGGLMLWLLRGPTDSTRSSEASGTAVPAPESPVAAGTATPGPTETPVVAGVAAASSRLVQEVLDRERKGVPPVRIEGLYRDLEALPADVVVRELAQIRKHFKDIEGPAPPPALRNRARDAFQNFARRELRRSQDILLPRLRALETARRWPDLRAAVESALAPYRECGLPLPEAYLDLLKRCPPPE